MFEVKAFSGALKAAECGCIQTLIELPKVETWPSHPHHAMLGRKEDMFECLPTEAVWKCEMCEI